MIPLNQFFQELKTRNVRKTMAIYIGISLTTFGILKMFVETYSLPTTLFPYVVTILVCGSVSAFVFAWFHGKADKQDFTSREILIHSLVAIVAIAISINVGSKTMRRSSETIAVLPLTNMSGSKTIAVLPFVNMSSDPDQEYFSDGLSEELLNVLSKITGLRVTSRTSSFSFKGTKTDIKTIAAKLNVQHILEGSVRKSGKTLRITAQLIDVETDAHLWSDTYDGTLENIFAVQDTISRSVAEALKITLLGKGTATLQKQTDPEAYNAYLLGKHFFNLFDKESLKKAVGYFEKALSIDPGYAPARVSLSGVYMAQADRSYIQVDEGYRKARQEAVRALELDPNLAAAYSQMGLIKQSYVWDFRGANELYQRGLELEPGNIAVLRGAASLAATLGRFDEAILLTRRTIEFDPVRTSGYYNLGFFAYCAGMLDVSETAFRKALDLNPQFPVTHLFLGRVYLEKGKPDSALAEMMRETEPDWQLFGLALAYHSLGKDKEADLHLARLIEEFNNGSAYQIAEIYAYRGETDKAFEWLERAYVQRDGGLTNMKGDPLLRNIEKDSRYAKFMKKMKLPL